MTKKQKRKLARIAAAAVLFAAALAIVKLAHGLPFWAGMLIMAVPFLAAGWDVICDVVRKLFSGQVFDESLLMSIASIGAFLLCLLERDAAEAHEAVIIMLLYQLGELFQSIAVGKSRRSVSALLDMMPDEAEVERDGGTAVVSPEEVEPGEILVIRPGARVPLDGTVIEGISEINTAPLTGESLPRDAEPGDDVLSGCINMTGLLRVRVNKPFTESTAGKIMELVENAGARKSKSENFISVFARVYTPIVTGLALLLAVIPSLIVGFTTGGWGFAETWRPYVHAALMFLIVSCPCALVISVPLSFFGGIGGACSKGILIKGSAFVEALAKCKTAVFDKTGTLTKGDFTVSEVLPEEGITKEELLGNAAAVESFSGHPVAQAIVKASDGLALPQAGNCMEHAGRGVSAEIGGKKVLAGNLRLMESEGLTPAAHGAYGSAVYVAKDGKYLGCIVVSDTVKEKSAAAVKELKDLGVRAVMLTGDRRESAGKTAAELGIGEYEAELLPEDKVTLTAGYIERKEKGSSVAFIGDGINDAPVLAGADVGIAMGALGSDAAVEAADVVLMNDDPADVPKALRICRKTMRLVKENVVFALTVKFSILLLLFLMTLLPGMESLARYSGEFAVFADVGVSVIAILNAMRALK